MVALTGQTVNSTYKDLLQVSNSNSGVDGTLRSVSDGEGTASALQLSSGAAAVDNLKLDGNTLSSTDTNGHIVLDPNGSGTVDIDAVAITGGTIAGTTISTSTLSSPTINTPTISGGSFTGGTDIVVADGGTGRSSATAYAVICGGTTSTAAQQSVASVGTSGQVLTSNGAGALPTFQGGGSYAASGSNSDITALTGITGVISNASQINCDNLRLDGNTLSSTNSNGNISLAPNGTGQILTPTQASFSANLSGTQSDKTGDGTLYTIPFDSENYDNGSNFAANTFTAPVSGTYLFTGLIVLGGLLSGHTICNIFLSTGAGDNYVFAGNVANLRDSNNQAFLPFSIILGLSAAATIVCKVQVSNSTKVVDIIGGSGNTGLQGVLLG